MALKKHVSLIFLLLSIYLFVQSVCYGGAVAHLFYFLAPPKVDGIPVPFSPHQLIPYFNMVLYVGLLLSSIFFLIYAEPRVRSRVKHNLAISIPLTIAAVPFYLGALFIITCGAKNLFH